MRTLAHNGLSKNLVKNMPDLGRVQTVTHYYAACRVLSQINPTSTNAKENRSFSHESTRKHMRITYGYFTALRDLVGNAYFT
ncbi:MAG: hypothetical protein FWE48_04365 [Coriobacteriia bacterium]|nr:hypothetical protein [Coriobacteriia bacterium]